jgi:hypothetical protein
MCWTGGRQAIEDLVKQCNGKLAVNMEEMQQIIIVFKNI